MPRLPEGGVEDTQLAVFGTTGAPPLPAAPAVLGTGWTLDPALVPNAIAAIEFFTVFAKLFEPVNTNFSWRMCWVFCVRGSVCVVCGCGYVSVGR